MDERCFSLKWNILTHNFFSERLWETRRRLRLIWTSSAIHGVFWDSVGDAFSLCKELKDGRKLGRDISNYCENRNWRWKLSLGDALFWGTVLNKDSNKKAARCCSIIRALRSHSSHLKPLQFHNAQIRGKKMVGGGRFTTRGPPQRSTSAAPFNWLFVWVLLLYEFLSLSFKSYIDLRVSISGLSWCDWFTRSVLLVQLFCK